MPDRDAPETEPRPRPMAHSHITIHAVYRWVAEEPDDLSPCLRCGEPAFLRRWRLEFRVVGGPTVMSEYVLCDACFDAAKDSEGADDGRDAP